MKHVIATFVLLTVASSTALADEAVRLLVTSHDTAFEFTVDPTGPTLTKISTDKRAHDQPFPESIAAILRGKAEKKRNRLANGSLATGFPSTAKWAEYSPNCTWVLIGGFEEGLYDAERIVAIGRSNPWEQIQEVRLSGSNYIVDHAWSPDSRYVLIVDTEVRHSRSPLALLSGLAGHPVPLGTLFLTAIDTQSGQRVRTKFMDDLPYPSAAFITKEVSCAAH